MFFKTALITGGAGCIGSSLAERLLNDGVEVTVIDNLSSGKSEHVEKFMQDKKFTFIKGNILEYDMEEIVNKDVVFHMSANPDIKYKEGDATDEDLRENTIATYKVLEAMRAAGSKNIVFASSSAVYGEAKVPTPEDTPLHPISLYGASKSACEHLIGAYCSMFGFNSWIYRFSNVVGGKSRKTGTTVLTDFINRLRNTHNELLILGNGKQKKAYMTNDDCVEGMLYGVENSNDKINIFNLGPDDCIEINKIAKIVASEMKLEPKIVYSGGDRGRLGDVPVSFFDTKKMKALGWEPKHNSEQAVLAAVRQLLL